MAPSIRFSRQVVRWQRLIADDPGHGPRRVSFRQLGATHVTRKRAQVFGYFGFENVETHELQFLV
jgi:hypothetical protein